MKLLFYLFSFVAIISSVLVVTLKNIMHCALFLALALLSTAGLFLLMNADFIAAVQVLVYAGGIMVLIVFAILLTQRITGKLQPQTNEQKAIAFIFSIAVLSIAGLTISVAQFSEVSKGVSADGTVALLGKSLLNRYVLPFEIASIVILAVIVSAIVIARKEE